jgi:ABC-2 type transport system permease protein
MLSELHLPAGLKPQYESPRTKMMVFSDGNLIANKVHEASNGVQILPLGYDRYAKQTFGNKAFFVNAVQYLCDDSGLMELRTRTVKLRLLDKVKLREEKLKWQLLNLLVPVLFILLFGVVFNFIRRKRYAH